VKIVERYMFVTSSNCDGAEPDDRCHLLQTNDGDLVFYADYAALEQELLQERGLKALLANGMPPTGNAAFDEVLATQPVAAMIQRVWLQGVSGFDDLPALESAICHFWGVATIEEAVNPKWPWESGKEESREDNSKA